MILNIVCTGKPGDGLLRYSYEHCCYLNSVGIESQCVIIPNPKHPKEDYIKAIKDQYKTYENIVFDYYTPSTDELTLVLGRSMITLPYLDKHKYTKEQLLTLHLLFNNNVIALYSENHPEEYPLALRYFKTKKVWNLCDHEVYQNGVGKQYEKIINFDVYKPVKDDIQYKHLFLGTNEIYYKEIEKVIKKYPDNGIITYNEKWINRNSNNLFAPISNILGKFETYVYTKPNFDPAPRLFVEFRWLGKKVEYLRDKNIKDGGMVYWNRPVPTKQIYSDNINILIDLIKKIRVLIEKYGNVNIVRRKRKSMLGVIEEVQRKYLPAMKKGWDDNILPQTSNLYYKRGWDKNPKFPKGQQEIELSKLWIDKSIQAEINVDTVDRIIKNFDPSKCLPIECIKSKHKSSRTSIDVPEDKYYVIDGRHRVIVFGILGITKIQTIVQDEKLIEDYYRENNPILVDAETRI